MSHGPFRHLHALIAGFVIGTVAFLAVAAAKSEGSGVDQLPLLLSCSIGGAALLLCATAVGNLLIGRRILEQRELERAIFANGTVPPPMPRGDVPGFVPASAFERGASSRKERPAFTVPQPCSTGDEVGELVEQSAYQDRASSVRNLHRGMKS